jgi:hypothetical protein
MKKLLFSLTVFFIFALNARVVEFQDIVDNSDYISSFIVQDYELTQDIEIDVNSMNYTNPYDSKLFANLCTSRQYELDSPDFFENCIELKNGKVPECENQCEFTYSRPLYKDDCPPCLKKKSVMDKLNPVRSSKRRDVSESEWKATQNFKMCEDADGDEYCDDEEFKICGVDEYDWQDVCDNPERYRVRPVDGGHEFPVDNCPKVYNPETYNESNGIWSQADWNEDGIGDACDLDGDGIEDDVDPRVYFAQGGTKKLNFEDPRNGYINNKNCAGSSMVGYCFGDGWFGRTLNIKGFVGIKDTKKSKSKIEAKFCYCGNDPEGHNVCKESGFCGRNHVRTGRFWDLTGKTTWRTAHEDEDFTKDVAVDRYSTGIYYNEERKEAPQIDTGMKKAGFSWDWGYSKNSILSKVPEVAAESELVKGIIKWTGNYPAIRISFAPVNKISEPYAIADGVNIKRYENYYQEATPNQLGSTIEYAFSDKVMIDLIIEKRATKGSAWWLPSLPPSWWYLIDHFRPGLADFRPMPGDPWEWNSSIGSAEEVSLRPEVLTSAILNERGMILKALKNDSPYQQIFKMGAADFIYSYENSEYVIKMANDAGFFQKKAVVEDGINMKSASVLVDGNKIFMAGNLTCSSGQYAASEESCNYNNVFGVIDVSATGAVMTTLSTPASNNSSYLKLIMLNDVIFMITENETGAVDVFRYLNGEEESETWEFVTSWQFNSPVALNNGTVKDNVFHIPAPKDQNKTEIVSFNGTEFGNFQTIDKAYDAYLKLYDNTGVLTAVDTKYLTDDSVSAFIITAEGVSEIEIPVIKSSMVPSTPQFCIYENNNSILPGARNSQGECIPVYNYNYQTVYYPDYKRTVAGIGNSLYLGGLTGVRRVEIKEDGSLRNREMVFTSHTHNLAKQSNVLYGASGNRIYVYETDETGSITGTTSFSASSCTNLRVVDEKLFTAENRRVRVFDLSDSLNPYLIKTIPTSGNVIDLEVVGDKLYIYEETVSWLFMVNGYTVVYDISDLNAPVMEKSFKKRCVDAEMQSSGDMIYLGCKNGQHRIEESGLVNVQGEKNFVREGYVYDRNLYQVFGGALHKSKVAVKIAVCGDGLIENNEICDSDIISCTELSSIYVGGIAACNSTCDGYNESVCETDGW